MTEKAQSQKDREASRVVMEYAGDLKFGMAEGKPVIPRTSLTTWLENARSEFVLKEIAARILNATDEEMEAWVREADNPEETIEALTDICERAIELVERYKAGINVFNAVAARIIVIGERYAGPEKAGRA